MRHTRRSSVSTPPAVVEELRAEDEAIAAEQAASAVYAGLPAGEAAEKGAIGGGSVAGKKRPPVTDGATERVVALAVVAERVRLTKVASAELQATIGAELPAWRTRLLADLADAHAKARAAARAVRPAVDRFTGALRAAQAIDAAIYGDDAMPSRPLPADVRARLNGRNAAAPPRRLLFV